MFAFRCGTIRTINQIERQFLFPQELHLTFADKILGFLAHSRNRTGADQEVPNLFPLVFGDANEWHSYTLTRSGTSISLLVELYVRHRLATDCPRDLLRLPQRLQHWLGSNHLSRDEPSRVGKQLPAARSVAFR